MERPSRPDAVRRIGADAGEWPQIPARPVARRPLRPAARQVTVDPDALWYDSETEPSRHGSRRDTVVWTTLVAAGIGLAAWYWS